MGLWSTLRNHQRIANGDFGAMFADIELPPLPAAVARLLAEINAPEPDVGRLTVVITAEPKIAAQVLRTVNSAMFNLASPVSSVQQAIALLGLQRITALVLPHALHDGLPKPEGDLFDHEVFWADSLLRALIARRLTELSRCGPPDTAFTAMLIADIALPVLMTCWRDYYEPLLRDWSGETVRLAQLEEQDFGWDHGEAGAWILHNWDFPEQLVQLVGLHTRPCDELHARELADTTALPLVLASATPSVAKPDPARADRLWRQVSQELRLSAAGWGEILSATGCDFAAICRQFELTPDTAAATIEMLVAATANDGVHRES